METVGVVIPAFGDIDRWMFISERAVNSVKAQTVSCKWIYVPKEDGTLVECRNYGAGFFIDQGVDWLIFLDADDELDFQYVEYMLKGEGDIRQPSTLGVVNGIEDDYPVLIQPKSSLLIGNHLIIGSMVSAELFARVGGFRELPILEDWDLWIRCKMAGADIQACPQAIYRVHVTPGSRNQNPELHGQVYQEIQQRYQYEYLRAGL